MQRCEVELDWEDENHYINLVTWLLATFVSYLGVIFSLVASLPPAELGCAVLCLGDVEHDFFRQKQEAKSKRAWKQHVRQNRWYGWIVTYFWVHLLLHALLLLKSHSGTRREGEAMCRWCLWLRDHYRWCHWSLISLLEDVSDICFNSTCNMNSDCILVSQLW